jgi:hypothetical protein
MSGAVARKYLCAAAVVATLASGAGPDRRGLHRALLPQAAGAPAPTGYVLPYTIAYSPGWQASGSLRGYGQASPRRWSEGDYFNKRAGNIIVEAETLPPG